MCSVQRIIAHPFLVHVPSGATSGSTREWHLMDILSVSSLYTAAILGFSIVTKLLSVVVRVGLNSTVSVMSCDRSLSRGAKKKLDVIIGDESGTATVWLWEENINILQEGKDCIFFD